MLFGLFLLIGNVMNLSKSLFAITLGCTLVACGGDKSSETAQQANTATQTKSGNTIVVATSPDFAPYSYLDAAGNVTGLDIDLINAIASKKGLNVEFKPTSFEQIFKEVENKTADVAVSAVLQTEERASKYGLTQPYGSDSLVYFYRADNAKLANMTLNGLPDLANKDLTLAATIGTKQMEYVGSVGGATPIPTKTDFLAFTNVLQQRADAGFTDRSILRHFIKNNLKENPVDIKDVAYQEQPTNYVMVLNKDNVELINKLNEGISELTQSGEIQALKQKYEIQ